MKEETGQGAVLKEALRDAGLTQVEYCKMRGIPLRTFQNWISGKTVLSGWLRYFLLKDLGELAKDRKIQG